ncbi:hypothetical protein MAIC_24500 [Mycolicibacterium aichiense]|uniref:Uncharacterized protein n=1 Tax=Mycolicibacterium aichiense TaxID=1799 RepID=A0AAD1HLJ8_9MYCO|nr:hypothetical protein MAIC_24500 [Mycolicibacterium aichiense]
MWAAKKANGNQIPRDVAQSRSCTAVGNGTSNTTAMRITAATAVAMRRVREIWRAVEIIAERTLRHVLRTFDVTFTKVTALPRERPAVRRRLPAGSHSRPRHGSSDHLA